jgi:hypothetical protein
VEVLRARVGRPLFGQLLVQRNETQHLIGHDVFRAMLLQAVLCIRNLAKGS